MLNARFPIQPPLPSSPNTGPHPPQRRASAVRDRAGPHDEENSGAVVERIVHCDQAVRIDDDFFRKLLRIQSGMERATLLVPPGTGDATVKDARKHGAWLCNLRERLSHEVRDDAG